MDLKRTFNSGSHLISIRIDLTYIDISAPLEANVFGSLSRLVVRVLVDLHDLIILLRLHVLYRLLVKHVFDLRLI